MRCRFYDRRMEPSLDRSNSDKVEKVWSLQFSQRLQYSEANGFEELDNFNIREEAQNTCSMLCYHLSCHHNELTQ